MQKKILLLILISVLVSCDLKRTNNLYSTVPNSIAELAQKMYELVDTDTFFELCQSFNDSINNRKDYFYLHTATFVNEKTNEVCLGIVELKERIPLKVSDRLILRVCIKDEKTIFVSHKQIEINNLRKNINKYIFEPNSFDKDIVSKKVNTDTFGEIEVSKVGVILSINAKGEKLSSNEWLLFFKCLREVVTVFENERDILSIKKTKKNYNSLNFEQKKVITEVIGYPIMLIFDKECSPSGASF